jgi:hypothetical protein
MTLFVTNNVHSLFDYVESGLDGAEQLAFVCTNADQEPILIIFAEHHQRYDLADILRSTAAQIPEAIPNYDGIIKS